MMTSEWLESRGIDIQSIEPDMLAALQAQYDAELERSRPAPLLVVPIDCSYPQRGHWVPVSH